MSERFKNDVAECFKLCNEKDREIQTLKAKITELEAKYLRLAKVHKKRTKSRRHLQEQAVDVEAKLSTATEALENIKKHVKTVMPSGYEKSPTYRMAEKGLKEK